MTLDDLRRAAELLPAGASLTLPREAVLEALRETKVVPIQSADRLLTAREVAARLSTSPRYIYANRRNYPFTRQLNGRVVRFSEHGLNLWLNRRAG